MPKPEVNVAARPDFPAAQHHEPGWVSDVLRYWFEELTPAQWFKRDDKVDRTVLLRFLDLHASLARVPPPPVSMGARTFLAAVIVLDQFPRNMFRGRPEAFATDGDALGVARAAVDAELDRRLGPDERLFLYLPFEHSESRDDQIMSLALISAIGNAEYTRFAEAHKVIIDRFGRFPHRNAVLGRASTPEELAFLNEPMSSF
jgi:uncharacterized protein (DUF924 family)